VVNEGLDWSCDYRTLSGGISTVSSGLGPAAEEIGKLPFGEISWPMSGNESIAEVVG
jgi:hypothetical protein